MVIPPVQCTFSKPQSLRQSPVTTETSHCAGDVKAGICWSLAAFVMSREWPGQGHPLTMNGGLPDRLPSPATCERVDEHYVELGVWDTKLRHYSWSLQSLIRLSVTCYSLKNVAFNPHNLLCSSIFSAIISFYAAKCPQSSRMYVTASWRA